MLIENRKKSIRDETPLMGICGILSALAMHWGKNWRIVDFPELMALNTENLPTGVSWWSINNKSMTRINKVKKVIKQMEIELNVKCYATKTSVYLR